MRIWDFAEQMVQSVSPEAVTNLFVEAVGRQGFTSAALRVFSPTTDMGDRVPFRRWPQEWERVSAEYDIPRRSPVIAAVRKTLQPFSWGDLWTHEPSNDNSVWDVARSWGWQDGFVIPVHGPGGYVACVSMGTRERETLDDPAARARLHMMGTLLHQRRCALAAAVPRKDLRQILTPRELECARWIACGKTNAETGMILGISALTVRFHVDNVRSKLGLYSRAQVAAHLALSGLL